MTPAPGEPSGRNPLRSRTMPAEKMMAARLVRYSRNALRASPASPRWAVMPTVASGGTRATAMPTPGRAEIVDRRGWMNPAAAPAVMAMPRSSRPGNVRDRISSGRARTSMTRPAARSDTNQPTAMASTVPPAMITMANRSRRFWARTVAAAAPMIGVMSGATSIAPITTAPELASRPNAAIDDDSAINAAKRATYWGSAEPSGRRSSSAATASSSGGAARIEPIHSRASPIDDWGPGWSFTAPKPTGPPGAPDRTARPELGDDPTDRRGRSAGLPSASGRDRQFLRCPHHLGGDVADRVRILLVVVERVEHRLDAADARPPLVVRVHDGPRGEHRVTRQQQVVAGDGVVVVAVDAGIVDG